MLSSISTVTTRMAGAGAALLLTAAGLVAAAPTSQAAGSGTTCPSSRLCFYFNSNLGGARADFAYSDAGLDNELFTDGPYGRNGWGVVVGNNAASVRNNSGRWVTLFEGRNCDWNTKWAGINGGGYSFNLAEFDLQNRVSSFLMDGSACVNRDQSNQ